MNPRTNPYSPGAGTIPPELAGRDKLVETISIELDRCRNGYAHRGQILVGLRGVGKTVLLNKLSVDAESDGFLTVFVETPENRSLPALLIPAFRNALIRSDRMAQASELGRQALKKLGGFVRAMKLKYSDIEFSLDIGSEEGADTGDLESDLANLLIAIGEAAKEKQTAFIIFIDEIQYIDEAQFASLIMALHKSAQRQLPISIIGAGLPQIIGQVGRAKSYAERLFEYPQIGPLNEAAANAAIIVPASIQDIEYRQDALKEIFEKTQGYPYFIQEWGKHCWKTASESPITIKDVVIATSLALTELDAGFFRVRLDRCTPSEKIYLRAMAELGCGPYKSGDIAELMGRTSQQVAPLRATLIGKGMIFSPAYGDNCFTVPLFEDFMKRVVPEYKNPNGISVNSEYVTY